MEDEPATQEKKPKRMLKIAMEGNIATGKSTFLDILAKAWPEAEVVQEPISRWTKIPDANDDPENITCSQKNGGNLLDMFYKDSSRWAYTFQTYCFLSRMRAQLTSAQESTSTMQIFERSVYSDRLCFAANCHDSGLFSDMEWNIYCDWHTFLLDAFGGLKLDGIIYLRATPDVSHSRLQIRDRTEENGLPLTYLQSIYQKHEDWLIHNKIKVCEELQGVPVLVIDCDTEFQHNDARQAEMLAEVKEFINTLDS